MDQIVQFGKVVRFNFKKPAGAIAVCIDLLRMGFKILVDGKQLAAQRSHHFTQPFAGFHLGKSFALFQLFPFARKLDINDFPGHLLSEVIHTHHGQEILENFLTRACRCKRDWTMSAFVETSVRSIAELVGSETAICGLSGGVDSTVAALLVHKAMGDRLTCVFIDNGLLRKNEFESVLDTFRRHLHLKVVGVDAKQRFLSRLRDIEDPEKKRKIIGEEFIRVFENQARELGNQSFLVQGTLYPDVIESTSVRGPSAVIKSHHNVGGLPKDMKLKLIEPLRELFKDEVRKVGEELGMEPKFVYRHPFPGPGLAVRILGAVTEDRLALLREADAIVQEEIERADLLRQLWQAFVVLLPIRSVGVMGDDRTYENVAALRIVTSMDGMTADWAKLPYPVLEKISTRIVNEVRGINRVVYDITSKPPGTIEWE